MGFAEVFDASVALQNGDEVTAMIDGNRLMALAVQGRFVLMMGGTLVREGDAFDVALAFVRTCQALDRGRQKYSSKSSHTRFVALKQPIVELVEAPLLATARKR